MTLDESSSVTPPQQPEIFQAGWVDLLPRFLGCTLLLIVWFALQGLGWLTEEIFHAAWLTVVAAIFGLALLPHWISALVALTSPLHRRLIFDRNGVSYRIGMSAHAADWSQCGRLTMARSLFGRPVLRASGGLRTRSWLWAMFEWPLLLIAWLIMVGAAVLLSPAAGTAIDFPSRDSYTIPRLFYRGHNLQRLETILGPHLQTP